MRTFPVAFALCTLLAFTHLVPAADAEKPSATSAAESEGRIEFVAYDTAHKPGEKDTFQIHIRDEKRPAMFLSVGDSFRVDNTKFTILRFEHKKRPHPSLGEEDVSELTLLNVATQKQVTVTRRK